MNSYGLIFIFYVCLIQLALTGILYYGFYLAMKSERNLIKDPIFVYKDNNFNLFGKRYTLMILLAFGFYISLIGGFLYLFWEKLPEDFEFLSIFIVVFMVLFIVGLLFIKHKIYICKNGVYIGWFITWNGFEGYRIENDKIILVGKKGIINPVHLKYNKELEDIIKKYLKKI